MLIWLTKYERIIQTWWNVISKKYYIKCCHGRNIATRNKDVVAEQLFYLYNGT